jgi:hypothetical protein
MFGDYSLSDLGAIFAMQGFAGLILFSVYVLMALGLAIIFGQMGVINMAHGEFMILGAYVTWMTSNAFQQYAPSLFPGYFFVAMILAFIASGALGMLVEWSLIRHLYKRPLDTLLATWGLSLILQQAYRSVFGAREVGVELPEWMMGSWQATDSIQIPINGMFVMGLTILITIVVAYVLFLSRWGRQVRAVVQNRVMAGAVGIYRESRPLHFRSRLWDRRHRGQRLHHDRLDRADGRTALHRRYIPGRGVRWRRLSPRHHRLRLYDLASAIDHGVLPVGLDGQGSDSAWHRRDPDDAAAGTLRAQGPQITVANNGPAHKNKKVRS